MASGRTQYSTTRGSPSSPLVAPAVVATLSVGCANAKWAA
jgi:hypothetical protein